MSGEEYEALRASVRKSGAVFNPVTLYQGKILDGWHRYRVGRELGVPPRFVQFDGPGTPEEFVLAQNLDRRHLAEGARAVIAAKISGLGKGRPVKNARDQAFTQAEAARKLKVGRSSVQQASKVLKNGTPELVRAVEREQISVSRAAEIARGDQTRQASDLQDHLAGKSASSVRRPPRRQGTNGTGAVAEAPAAFPVEVPRQDEAAVTCPREAESATTSPEAAGDHGQDSSGVDLARSYGGHCRVIDEHMPRLLVAIEAGLGVSDMTELASRVRVARTALSKVALALEKAEAAALAGDD